MKVNERVRQIRKSKGITQVFVAKSLKIPVQTYNGYELGRRELKADTLKQIAQAINEPVENFFEDEIYESKKSTTA